MTGSFEHINELGRKGIPFTFFISFDKKHILIFETNINKDKDFFFEIGNTSTPALKTKPEIIHKEPVSIDSFQKAFWHVQNNLHYGNSYLLNLTFRTPIELNCTLEDVFYGSRALYRGYIPHKFVFFSPESFIKIGQEGIIRTFPMKGTSTVANDTDGSKLLSNIKEKSEHNTVVDLLRNDLALVARDIEVIKPAYLDKILVGKGNDIWQMSTEIVARLEENWASRLGDILDKILPAGSISGAPKEKTLEIIAGAEKYNRGFYTGIAGQFDEQGLDSCVMIRFIEEENEKHYYYSGGGITYLSNLNDEYKEYIDKIYIPAV